MPFSNAQPHPLLGEVAPDLQLETRHGRTRVVELMHAVVQASRARCRAVSAYGSAHSYPALGQFAAVLRDRAAARGQPGSPLAVRAASSAALGGGHDGERLQDVVDSISEGSVALAGRCVCRSVLPRMTA